LSRQLEEHQKKLDAHDRAIVDLMNTIRMLMAQPRPIKGRPIGFITPDS
jgi:hypothetical protein